jgi:hypothetical protein
MRSIELGCFSSHSWSLWKALKEEGGIGLVSCVGTCGVEVLEYWMASSLKIKLNRSWKFQENWNVPLMWLERSWWAGFNGIYLVRFGFRMWEILIFKWFVPLKIQINSKTPGFGRKNQLRCCSTWGNCTGHTRQYMMLHGVIHKLCFCLLTRFFDSEWKMLKFSSCLCSQIIAAGCVGVFQTSHPWSKYRES